MFATSRISAVILALRDNSANPDISRSFCLAIWIFFQISDCGSNGAFFMSGLHAFLSIYRVDCTFWVKYWISVTPNIGNLYIKCELSLIFHSSLQANMLDNRTDGQTIGWNTSNVIPHWDTPHKEPIYSCL